MKKQFYLFVSIVSFFSGCLTSIVFLNPNEPNQQEDEQIYKYVFNGNADTQPGENDKLIIDFIDEETKTYFLLPE